MSTPEEQLASLREKLRSATYAPPPSDSPDAFYARGLISISDAEQRFGISRDRIRKWIQRDKIRSYGPASNRQKFVSPADIEPLVYYGSHKYQMGAGDFEVVRRPTGHGRLIDEPLYNHDEIQLVTVADAAKRVEVTESTVRSWASRGYLDANGVHRKLQAVETSDYSREKLYNVQDIYAAAAATCRRAGRERTHSPAVREILLRFGEPSN